MSAEPLILLTRLQIKPERMEDAVAAVSANVVASATEPGVARMALHREEGADRLWIVEVFADEAAVEAHEASSHFAAVVASLPDLLDAPPESIRLSHLPTGDSPKDRVH